MTIYIRRWHINLLMAACLGALMLLLGPLWPLALGFGVGYLAGQLDKRSGWSTATHPRRGQYPCIKFRCVARAFNQVFTKQAETQMKKFIEDMKGNVGAIMLGLLLAFVLVVMVAGKVMAADPKWTGFGIGGQGGIASADGADNTQLGGGHAALDLKAGNVVFGAFVEYNWLRGDGKDAGVNNELALGGRACVLIAPNVCVGGRAAWSQLDTIIGKVDGYKFGPALDVALPTDGAVKPYLGISYDQGRYEENGQSLTTHSVMARLTFKFQETEKPLQDLIPEEKPAAKPAAKAKKVAP